ncbi:MAG: hypothetical protein JWR80_1798 [Bradyrhizobium sp.]|nr:hypothetical protein [Bradyrhizobium sp.]
MAKCQSGGEHMKLMVAALTLLALGACTTTRPFEAASINYRLPKTTAKVTLAVDVTVCDPSGAQTKATLKLDTVAASGDTLYRLEGNDLASGSIKRAITVGTDDNGVISSVNSAATDQTSVILGDVIKIAATAAAFAANGDYTPILLCNSKTKANLVAVDALDAQITALRASMASAADPAAVEDKIQKTLPNLVALRTSLHREVTADVTIDRASLNQDVALNFDLKAFEDLFETAWVGPPPAPAMVPGIADKTAPFAVFANLTEVAMTPAVARAPGKSDASLNDCSVWMYVPQASPLRVALKPNGPMFDKNILAKPDALTFPFVAAQLNGPAKLCLSVGFGENRTIALKFDKFGRTTEFTWNSDARAANVANALAGAAPDIKSAISTVQGASLASDKVALDKLTTAEALRKARACAALIEQGAASCPKE